MEDEVPELSSTYIFHLHTPMGGTELHTNISHTTSTIIIAASDHPYGVFGFTTPLQLLVDEHVGNVVVPVERSEGKLISEENRDPHDIVVVNNILNCIEQRQF